MSGGWRRFWALGQVRLLSHPGEIDRGGRPSHTPGPHHEDVSEATPYQIVLKGRPSDRLLRPFLDDFAITSPDSDRGATVLVGRVQDSSHLHGLLNHLTSLGVEIVSITPYEPANRLPKDRADATDY